MRLIVIGAIAAALQGSPIAITSNRIEVIAHAHDRERGAAELAGTSVLLRDDPPGTRGYGDLARSADGLALADRHTITVASLQDLVRIALSGRDEPSSVSAAIGLDAALRARRAHERATDAPTADGALDAIERWLDQQTPLAQ